MRRLVLVTGAAGALGRRVLPVLRSRGWTIRCLVHRRSVAAADETIAGNLLDAFSLAAAVAGVDSVLHLAAVTHARTQGVYDRVNVDGTRALVTHAESAGVRRFVHASSRAASAAGGAYARSKLESEAVVAASGVEHTIVRLSEIYGAGGHEGIERIVAQARRGRPIPVVGRGSDEVCPVHVDDIVAALVAALDTPAAAGKLYTLGGDCMSIRTFAARCAQAFGTKNRLLPVPIPVVALLSAASRILPLPLYPDQLQRLRAPKDIPGREAARDLGFAPRLLEDGLREIRKPR